MSICASLMKGFDLECAGVEFRKYFQNVILINKDDVENYLINSNFESNNIAFNLYDGLSGFLFRSTEIGSSISGEFSKSETKGLIYYDHKVTIPVMGVDENSKTLLKQLDNSNYFAAMQFKDGTIEVYGFNYGLKTNNYSYTPQGNGGAIISLDSKYSELDPPYVYSGNSDDFNNLFANIPNVNIGDFNNDFNDDFFIE